MTKPTTAPGTLSIHIPFRIAKRGGRRQVQMPPGAPVQHARIDNTLVKALARAFRWQRMLENGTHATLLDLAQAEKINPSYLSRMLRLTLLAPATVDAIIDGTQVQEVTLTRLMEPFPAEWRIQQGGDTRTSA
jgi:hypothetical protein